MKKITLLLPCLLLMGCLGYSSLYSANGQNLAQVSVGKIVMKDVERNVGSRRVAQLVSQRLEQTFPSYSSTYTLEATIEESIRALAVRRDAVEQRLSLDLTSVIKLEKDGKQVLRARASATSSYNVEDSPFGTEAGRDRARRSAAERLSEEIVEKVTVFLHQQQGQ